MARARARARRRPIRPTAGLTRQDGKTLLAAWLGYLMDGFDFVLITLVLTEVADAFGLSTVTAATLVSAAFISRWFGGLAIGAVGDRYGRKPAMILSILLYSLGSLACGLSWGYWSMFAARLVLGLGMAGEYSASATYVIESWPATARNRASALLISGYAVGSVIAGQLYRFVVPAWGWRAMFFLGFVPIALALWMRRGLRESGDWERARGEGRAASEASGQRGAEGEGQRRDFVSVLFRGRLAALNHVATAVVALSLFLLFTERSHGYGWPLAALAVAGFVLFTAQFARARTPMVLTLMVTVFCAFLYSWPIQALLPTYLKDDLGFSPSAVSDVLFFAGFGNVAGCLLVGFLGDRWGTRRTYVAALCVSLLFVLPVFAMDREQTVSLALLLFLQQMFAQGISGLLPKLIGGYFATSERAAGLGFTYNVGALGGAVAPVLGASLAGGHSLGPSLAWLTFSLTLVVIVLIAVNAPLRVQRLCGDRSAATGTDLTEGRAAERAGEPSGAAPGTRPRHGEEELP
ncbi:sialate:H+ symport family MFS transporter [Streptomyces tubbatahanensis]|uniref:Sialate:H+ symport family MFS transporter n=1 Tax=Streptomyces tubbatahanensis TaxID=2923272 RepID=A0ABY3Y000_9ACTN|nr:sialate:H+ symport family MFS transporter [Streptomyces tubbatahanensis]UNT00123.1 sialate:H+ symport family MFS transporter [Streptomyces tubbatahanensis]